MVNGITLLFDVVSAQRARGAVIDWVESMQGAGLTIRLPSAPAPVIQMSVHELKEKLDANEIVLVDVRPAAERAKAEIADAGSLDGNGLQELEALPKDTALAFICHTGNRSNVVGEHFRRQGFTNVNNVVGGIDAWAKEIDSSVPLY